MYNRGDCFRREFSRLGEVRSIIPKNVHVMALTAIATKSMRAETIKSLDMQRPVIVSIPPIKDYIFYSISSKFKITFSLGPVCDRLAHQRTDMGRTIIFCWTYDEVTDIYYFFKQQLGIGFTDPPGASDLTQFHLTDQSVKDKVLTQFTSSSALPRVIIATIAFGIGIDCPDVRQIIHWGVPEDVEKPKIQMQLFCHRRRMSNKVPYWGLDLLFLLQPKCLLLPKNHLILFSPAFPVKLSGEAIT